MSQSLNVYTVNKTFKQFITALTRTKVKHICWESFFCFKFMSAELLHYAFTSSTAAVSTTITSPASTLCYLHSHSPALPDGPTPVSLSVLSLNFPLYPPAHSFALISTHFRFLFISKRKSRLWAAQSWALRDSLHLNTWKMLLIMDYGGFIGTSKQNGSSIKWCVVQINIRNKKDSPTRILKT